MQDDQNATNVLCDQPVSFSSENGGDLRPPQNGIRKLSPSKAVPSKKVSTAPQNGGNIPPKTGVRQAWVCPECKLLIKKSVEIHQKSCKGHKVMQI